MSLDESSRENEEKKVWRFFYFRKEKKVGSASTNKVVRGDIQEGEVVELEWENTVVPAKILQLTGTYS